MVGWAMFWLAVGLIAFVVIGYYGGKHTGTFEKFLVTRGEFPAEVLGMSHASKAASAVLFVGLPGLAYQSGYSALWQSWPFFAAGIVGMLIVARRFRRDAGGALTVPDWIGERYGSDFLRAGFALIFMFNIAYIGGQMVGMALLYSQVFNLPYGLMLTAFAAVTFFYVIYGGNWAIVWTDFVQSILMAVAAVTIFSLGFILFPGGFGEITAKLSAVDPNLVAVFNPKFNLFNGPLAVVGILFFAFAFNGANNNTAKQFFTMKREGDAKRYILAALVMFTLFYFMPMAGTYARVLFPNIKPDTAVPTLIVNFLPAPLAGLITLGILAATLSTVDDILVLCGASFANDIYRKIMVRRGWVSRGRSEGEVEKTALLIQRIALVAILVVSALLVVSPPAYLTIFASTGSSGFFVSAFAPVMLGLYWKKANKWGALASLLVGTAVYIWTNFAAPTPYGFFVNSFLSGGSAIVAMVVVSALTPGGIDIKAQPESEAV